MDVFDLHTSHAVCLCNNLPCHPGTVGVLGQKRKLGVGWVMVVHGVPSEPHPSPLYPILARPSLDNTWRQGRLIKLQVIQDTVSIVWAGKKLKRFVQWYKKLTRQESISSRPNSYTPGVNCSHIHTQVLESFINAHIYYLHFFQLPLLCFHILYNI